MGADSGEDLIAGFTCKGSFDPCVLSVLCRLGFLVKPFQKLSMSQVEFCYKYFVVIAGSSAL